MCNEYYCNYCDTEFDGELDDDGGIACPRCRMCVVSKGGFLIHPANRVLSTAKAEEIILHLGWRLFKQQYPCYCNEHPELRPGTEK